MTEATGAERRGMATKVQGHRPPASPDKLKAPGRKKRERVSHFFIIKEAEIAEDLGVEVKYLCGHWGFPNWRIRSQPCRMKGSAPIEADDCKRCVRALAARHIPLVG